jgi:hypothetical protein
MVLRPAAKRTLSLISLMLAYQYHHRLLRHNYSLSPRYHNAESICCNCLRMFAIESAIQRSLVRSAYHRHRHRLHRCHCPYTRPRYRNREPKVTSDQQLLAHVPDAYHATKLEKYRQRVRRSVEITNDEGPATFTTDKSTYGTFRSSNTISTNKTASLGKEKAVDRVLVK